MARLRRGVPGAAWPGRGLIDGESIQVAWRWTEETAGEPGGADPATELAQMPLRLVVAPTLREVEAVRRANPHMPIVMVAVGDPVGAKLLDPAWRIPAA